MHKQIDKIKNNENKPIVLKNVLNSHEIEKFMKLYNETHQSQYIHKTECNKRWLPNYGEELRNYSIKNLRMKLEILNSNLKDEDGKDILDCFKKVIIQLVYILMVVLILTI